MTPAAAPADAAQAAESIDPLIRFGVVPLRLFLGATYVYAALQKLSDSGFLDPQGRTYIGRQLAGYAPQSPIGGVLRWLSVNTAQELGALVILTELVVGAGILAGLWTRTLAVVGAGLSVLLFLSATWSVQPYFLGSDGIYAVAFLTLALVGDQGVWVPGQRLIRSSTATRVRPLDPERRRLLLGLGGLAVAGVWVLGLLPRSRPAATGSTTALTPPSATPSPSGPSSPGTSPSPSASPSSPPGTRIGAVSDLRSAGSLAYQDPQTGDPAVAVAVGQSVVAYDAICTHAGCTVQYDPSQRLLVCPCHDATFDPARGAQVVDGPAPSPLRQLSVTVGPDGSVYATGGS